jgi:hypothetical protein
MVGPTISVLARISHRQALCVENSVLSQWVRFIKGLPEMAKERGYAFTKEGN